MPAKISLVLVTYHSAPHAEAAVASFRREAAAAGVEGEVVIVDHSESQDEAARLSALAPECLLPRPNRGYAAGLNTGVGASTGEVLLLANPDLELQAGSLAALLAPLGTGWHVVGPQFQLGPFLFPPADLQTPREELRRWLAARSAWAPGIWAWERHLRREVRRWCRTCRAPAPIAVPMLSGALLAAHRETCERLGPWDEGYFLYFEETDWLRRARRLGLAVGLVPAARVRHPWGHAARPEEHGETFRHSRRRYYAKHFGVVGRLISRLPSAPAPHPAPPLAAADLPTAPGLLWLLSPSPLGFPAAGLEGVTAKEIPAAVAAFTAERSRQSALTLLAYDLEREKVVGRWSVTG